MDVPKDMDQAAGYLAQSVTYYPPMSPKAEKKLLRKIDWILIPMVGSFHNAVMVKS